MNQINHPDEKTPTIKTDGNLVEVLLTPEEQVHIAKLRAEKVAPVLEVLNTSIVDEVAAATTASNLNDLETTTQPTELIEQTPEKKKLTEGQKKIVAFILSGLILAGIITGTIFANSKGKGQPIATVVPTPTEQSSSSTQPASSETTPTIYPELMPTVESLEIDASLLSDPEMLAKTCLDDCITAWFNAGATIENAEVALASKEGIHEYSKKVALEYDKIFIDAFLIEGWESNAALVKLVDNMKFLHQTTLELNYLTSFRDINSKDKVPYMRGTKCTEIKSFHIIKDKSTTLTASEYNYDNADDNRAESLTGGKRISQEIVTPTRIFTNVGGKIKLSDITLT